MFTKVSRFDEWITETISADPDLTSSSGKYCTTNDRQQCGSCDESSKLSDKGVCNKIDLATTYDKYENEIDDFVCPQVCLKRAVCQDKDENKPSENHYPAYTKCKCNNGEALKQCTSSTDDYCHPHKCNEKHYYDPDDRSCKKAVLPKLDFDKDTELSKSQSAFIATPFISGKGYNTRIFAQEKDLPDIAEKFCDYYAKKMGAKSNSTE